MFMDTFIYPFMDIFSSTIDALGICKFENIRSFKSSVVGPVLCWTANAAVIILPSNLAIFCHTFLSKACSENLRVKNCI